jgi:hypothetical protein
LIHSFAAKLRSRVLHKAIPHVAMRESCAVRGHLVGQASFASMTLAAEIVIAEATQWQLAVESASPGRGSCSSKDASIRRRISENNSGSVGCGKGSSSSSRDSSSGSGSGSSRLSPLHHHHHHRAECGFCSTALTRTV